MILVMEEGITWTEIQHAENEIRRKGLAPQTVEGDEKIIILVKGKIQGNVEDVAEHFLTLPGVEKILPVSNLHKVVTKKPRGYAPEERTPVAIGNMVVGNGKAVVIAGPCAVESRDQTFRTVDAVLEGGANALRLMLYKPRTNAASFQGLREEGIPILEEVRKRYSGVPVVSEAVRTREVPILKELADAIQIGARNATNYDLLETVAATGMPVILKRGMGSTMDDWFGAASYLIEGGNSKVIFCERGIRTFNTDTRFTLDISAIPLIHRETPHPVIVDPSHASGHWYLVPPLARAAVAAGADGVLLDVHPNPEEALVDGPDQLRSEIFNSLRQKLYQLCELIR